MSKSRIVKVGAAVTALAATAVFVVLAGGGGQAGSGERQGKSQRAGGASVSAETTTVAEAAGASVAVFDDPADAEPARRLANPQPSGTPLVFVVEDREPGWVQVQLPVRPNGSTGWVRTDDISLSEHRFRVEVDLSSHRLIAYEGAAVIVEETVAVGRPDTPTPAGRFYVKELLQPPEPGGPYGAYAFGLSGFSDVLTEFAGGEGVLGLHGTNDPSTLGTDVSHGCIRLSDEAITILADRLPLGTPVEIRV